MIQYYQFKGDIMVSIDDLKYDLVAKIPKIPEILNNSEHFPRPASRKALVRTIVIIPRKIFVFFLPSDLIC